MEITDGILYILLQFSWRTNAWTLDPLNPFKIINSFGDDSVFITIPMDAHL